MCRELFVDGYDAQGNRIYDKVNGQTCHQCRQKTLGKRTACAGCESLTVRWEPGPGPAAAGRRQLHLCCPVQRFVITPCMRPAGS